MCLTPQLAKSANKWVSSACYLLLLDTAVSCTIIYPLRTCYFLRDFVNIERNHSSAAGDCNLLFALWIVVLFSKYLRVRVNARPTSTVSKSDHSETVSERNVAPRSSSQHDHRHTPISRAPGKNRNNNLKKISNFQFCGILTLVLDINQQGDSIQFKGIERFVQNRSDFYRILSREPNVSERYGVDCIGVATTFPPPPRPALPTVTLLVTPLVTPW